jgi:hypothetical protein
MKTLRIKALLLLLALTSMSNLACTPKLEPEPDCNFVMSSEVQRVSWKGNLPVDLYISPDVPTEFRESIRIAAARWNKELKKEALIIKESDNIPSKPAKDKVNVIYWKTEWNDGKSTEQARTTIYWKGDMINEADVLINAKDHRFSQFGILEPSKVDFTSLMVHEFGHVLGLQHVHSEPSVMNPTLAFNTSRLDPTEVDLNSLKCEYKVGDS